MQDRPLDPRRRPPHAPRPRHPAISDTVLRLAGAPAAEVDAFWRRLKAIGTPLVEDDPADPAYRIVTFVWCQPPDRRDVEAVHLLVNCLTDRGDTSLAAMQHLPGTDVWYRSFRLRSDWRGSYQIAPQTDAGVSIQPGPQRHANAAADPLNRRPMPSRRGTVSVASLPGAPAQAWWEERPSVPRGRVSQHAFDSAVLGNQRPVWLYEPPVPASEPLPVLVLLDGDVWGPVLPVAPTLDNLIADGLVPPLAAVMPSSLDLDTRWRELACSPDFVRCLATELLPWAMTLIDITTDPRRTIIAGESLGGLAAVHAATACPQRFGNVLAQSASLWWPSGGEFDEEAGEVVAALAGGPKHDVRFDLSVGLREGTMLQWHRHLRDVLVARGYGFTYREYNGGHDYACWRGGIAEGLIALCRSWAGPA